MCPWQADSRLSRPAAKASIAEVFCVRHQRAKLPTTAINELPDGNMRHGLLGRGAVPVENTGRCPDHITGLHQPFGFSPCRR
jgi:hypothetical protein